MGVGRGVQMPLCILLLAVAALQQNARAQSNFDYSADVIDYDTSVDQNVQQQQYNYDSGSSSSSQKITIISGSSVTPKVKSITTAHNGKVCSTWGNFHFKTFDGNVFHFPGTCNYVYSSHCKSSYEDFNIQIRRTVVNGVPIISRITMKVDGVVIEINNSSIYVNGNPIQLPFSKFGVQIERNGVYIKATCKIGLVVMWNEADNLLMELDDKYANQTCGLCGDYNSISINDFISNGIRLTETQFGNMQKMDGPTEQCEDPEPTPQNNCTDFESQCEAILTGPALQSCNLLVGVGSYIEACVQDLCRCDSSTNSFCLCNTFAEYSRQCSHAGGSPQNWRTASFCPKQCPFNMQYQECGSPCGNTCSNSERVELCEEHCIDGCFCPPGTVMDDINNSGCIPTAQCACTYAGETYATGTSYSTTSQTCICTGGQWSCQEHSSPGTCSVEGGSHIATYDDTRYTVHGDCVYVLTKLCEGNTFTVLGELRKCGLTDSETCLKSVALSLDGGQTIIVIKPCGSVFVNWVYTQLPVSAANVTLFRPSSFYIIVHTQMGLQLQIQLIPTMQVYVGLDPGYQGKTCGLCGNFNNIQADDYQTLSGIVEGTAAAFANTWKASADCPNVKNIFENPCTLSIENEKYAEHWCGVLTDPAGPFASCHAVQNPSTYYTTCMYDTCNCEKTEECLCAALSTYFRACASKGVPITGWRKNVCAKYTTSCPKSMTYSYSVNSCQPTCRSLSEPDYTCNIKFVPVDGCTCQEGTYMDEAGKCVPAASCPCYFQGSAVPSGEVIHENGVMCTCTQGKLNCIGSTKPDCVAPMVYFDCANATVGTAGAECQKSCHTLDMQCYSTHCTSGCMCPEGLVSDGTGRCIKAEDCPCVHNDAIYEPGAKIKVKCNTCTCKNRMWECSNEPCLGTCAVYGDGHYITFDGKRYSFSGDCEYTLAQDHCGKDKIGSTFRVVTENIPCGTTGTTCSKAIKIFVSTYELILTDEHVEVVERGIGAEVPYKVRNMGIYLVIEADNGLILTWDRKTSIVIKLSADFKGTVCGLCGNYDGNANNDFTTRSQSVVNDVIEFGNSWKFSPTCPDAKPPRDPCSANPYRKSWAQKQCSIINSDVFSACHSQVDPTKYYDACVSDSCACDTGGDCECFCTAIAAYAQICSEFGTCVAWRTPNTCPLFCDYYNPAGKCEWHYKPCGASCMKTCRNPSGKCLNDVLPGLEGCYPSCPADKPYFDEEGMECTAQCGCYDDNNGKYYKPGDKVNTDKNCQSCTCTMKGIECHQDNEVCYCEYQGVRYKYQEVIYHTTDGIGGCINATCGLNGTIDRSIYGCTTTVPTTTFHFTSTTPGSTTTTKAPTTTICVREECKWSKWYDVSYPNPGMTNGDFDTFENIRAKGNSVCKTPNDIQCRAERFPNTPLDELEQVVTCNKSLGLVCYNKDQHPPICYNYQIRILCCMYVPCGTTAPPTTQPPTTQEETTTLETTTQVPTTTTEKHTTSTVISTTTSIVTTQAPSTTTPSTTELSTASTSCKPKCKWTNWFDVDVPSVGSSGGDYETYEKIREAGHTFCEKPMDIDCRAEKFPDQTIDQSGQIVQCNVTVGLLCKNEEQTGEFKMCLNYQIKVLCCDDYSDCSPTTVITALPFTTVETTTPTTGPETTTVTQTTTTTTPSTTSKATITSEITTSTTTPIPTTTSETTKETTTETTTPTTPEPTTTETTTPTTPETTTTETTTPVTTSTTTTTTLPTTAETTTSTETTTPTTTETTTPSTTTTTTTPPLPTTTSETTTETTTQTTTPETTTTIKTTTTTTPEPTTPTTISETTTTTLPTTTTETTTSTETTTQTTKPETTTTIKTATTPETTTSTTISETTTTTLPTTKTETTTSTETTTPTTTETTIATTTPSTTATTTIPPIPTTASETTTETTTQTTPPETTTTITTTTTTTPETTTPTTISETTTTTLPITTTETTTSTETTTPTTTETTTATTTLSTTAITTSIPIPITTSETTTETTTQTTTPETTTKITTTTTPETTTTLETQTTIPETTTTIEITTPTTTSVITTTPSTTTSCQPKCQWTKWFDVNFPSAGKSGGDIETYENIIASGETICKTPQNIKCRAENFPHASIADLGQVVQCNVTFGLICNNKEQIGKAKICYNYEISVLCCDDYSHCRTTPATTHLTTTIEKTTTATTTPSTSTTTTPIPTTTSETTTETTTQTTTPETTITTETTTAPETTTTIETQTTTPETAKTTEATTAKTTSATTTIAPTTTTTVTTTISETTSPTTISETTTKPPTTATETTTSTETTTPTTTETTTTTTATTPPSTTTSVITTTTETTTTPPPTTTSVITTTPSTTTSCQPKCQWTKWFDVNFPSSGKSGGDIETYDNIIASGENICKTPQDIKCRAENFPDVSIADLGQVVQCNLTFGLICSNKEQIGKAKMCYNYEISVLCCDDYSHCRTTPATTHLTTTIEKTTTATTTPSTTTTTTPIPTTTSETTTETTTQTTTPETTITTETTTTPETTTTIETQTTTPETAKTTEATTAKTTSATTTIAPTTTTTVTTTISETTSPTTISETTTKPQTTVTETTTTTSTETTTPTTTETTTTTTATTPPSTTTSVITTTTETTTTPPPTTTSVITTTPSTTTSCQPKCQWTKWFDVNFPSSGKSGGDIETYDNIIASGENICKTPQDIKCRAENFPDVSIADLGQVVQCNVTFGLICSNKEQIGKAKMCYNYEISVLCCDDYSHCGTTPATTHLTTVIEKTTTATSTPSTTTTTTPIPTTTSETTTETTTQTTTPETTITTETATTTSATTTTTEATTAPTTLATTTIAPTTTKTVTTTISETTIPTTISETTTTPPTTTTETTTTTSTETTTPTTTETTTTTTATTPPSTTTSVITTTTETTTTPPPTTTSVITTTPSTTTSCQPKCQWTKWFDVNFPSSGKSGGDIETYDNIIASGENICRTPQDIQCRAENFPDVSIADLGQVVQCNVTFGLICSNKEQIGKAKMCYNYEISVLCCDDYSHCRTTPSTTHLTTVIESTTTATSTPSTTTTTTPIPTTTSETTTETTTQTTTPESTITTETTTTTPATTTTTETTTATTTSATTTIAPTTTTTVTTTISETTSPTTISETTTTPPTTTTETTTSTETTTPTTTETTTTTTATTPPSTTTSVITTTIETTTTPPPTTTSVITTTPSTTASCQPKCQWTKWFDVNFPSSGKSGGDIETYDNIIASGENICKTPQDIKCRAENFPDVSIADLGQVVQCNVTFGLICSNKEQIGKAKMCYNYEISVLCCDDYSHCRTTPATTHLTTVSEKTTTATSTLSTTTTTTPIPTTTSETTTETTTQTITPETTITTETTTTTPETTTTTETTTATTTSATTPIAPTTTTGVITTISETTTPTTISETTTTPPPTTTETTTTSIETTTPTTTETTTTTATTLPSTTTSVITTTETRPTPSPTTTSVITTTPSATTPCKPKCQWTKWFDVNFPSSGKSGGDIETYDNIIASGGNICRTPQNIKCRAENFPNVNIADLGQVVQCDVTFGLICNNKDQTGKLKLCYNYEISVLCCDDYSHCATTPVIPTSTTTGTKTTQTTTSSTPETTTKRIVTSKATTSKETGITIIPPPKTTQATQPIVKPTTESSTPALKTTTSSSTASTPEKTTACFCHVLDTFFNPGDVIYNKTDAAGCIFYAVCNTHCEAERFQGPCPTPTPPPPKTTTKAKSTTTPATTTKQTSTSTSTAKTTPTTTTVPGCPPKQLNETWIINNCTVATCRGNNVVTIEPVKCPEVKTVTCESGFPPIKVYSDDGCCYHYECECVCSGWGDPHYITFDGTYYTFLDNCTYTLVKQITPRYDNFRILIDNYFCNAEDGLSCPQSLYIFYGSNEVMLTRMVYKGKMTNRIRFNKEWVIPSFTKNGISISTAGINMIVQIAEINAYVSFSGMIFVVKLPFSMFGYNTEGQCGTCSNNKKDDCRLPNGQIVADCSQMAPHWKVNVTEKPYCNLPPPPPKPTSLPTKVPPTKAPCKTPELCKVLMSDVFADCHALVPPESFYEGCIFDGCRISNVSVQCSSLEIYASLCISNGVCLDWRSKVNGQCPYTCPKGKVYNACGPTQPTTCDSNADVQTPNAVSEGCYCEPGTTLFNSYTDVCVPKCSCVGPDGMPKLPGDTWQSNCQRCTCEKNTLTVQCEKLKCPEPAPVTCEREGFVPVAVLKADQPCCLVTECQCNVSYCSNPVKKCPLGFEVTSIIGEGDCCATFICKPKDVCVYNGAIYQPGHSIPQSPDACEECSCTAAKNVTSRLNMVACTAISCNKDCPLGSIYKEVEGKCCGSCVQVACTMKMDDNTVKVLQPGVPFTPKDNNCTVYECTASKDQFVLTSKTTSCTVTSSSDCSAGFVYKQDAGQCCGECSQEACIMKNKDNSTKVIQPGDTWYPPGDVCVYYKCLIIDGQFVPETTRRVCSISEQADCQEGFKYEAVAGECCGNCVQVACTMKMRDNSTIVIQPGDSWTSPDNQCASYDCTENNGRYDLITKMKSCPAFDETKCAAGSIKMTPDGCCKTCEVKTNCNLRKTSTTFRISACQSTAPVELSYCEGTCNTSSMYSAEANTMEHKCSCCQELETSERQVVLTCLDGTSKTHTYVYVDQCGCTGTECGQTTNPQQQQHEDQNPLQQHQQVSQK